MKYKRVVVSKFGAPEVLKVVEDELRDPLAGEVLVRVAAAGVARADCNRRASDWSGQTPPFSLGYDFAGKVEAIGNEVTAFEVGQTVAGLNENLDSYSEYVYVKPEWMVGIGENVDLAQAACLGLNYLVAFQCIHKIAEARPGNRMLVLGASGGVGTALIDLGKLAGLEVYGTSSTAKTDMVRKLGAVPIDYQREVLEKSFKEIEFGVVFDGVFDNYLETAYSHLGIDGKYIIFGFSAAPQEYETVVNKIEEWGSDPGHDREIINFGILDPYNEDLAELAEYLAEGKISPEVYERVPLKEAAQAHRLLESGVVVGKVVLMCE